jgi:hypothetical protein
MKNQAQNERKNNRSKEKLQRPAGKIRLKVAVNRELERLIDRNAKKIGVSRARFVEDAVRENLSQNDPGVRQRALEDAVYNSSAFLETLAILLEETHRKKARLTLDAATLLGIRNIVDRERVNLQDSFECFIASQNAAR